MSSSIEQILATTEGQQQIGSIMATDDLFDAVMQQMSLLDIDNTIITNVMNYYDAKRVSMKQYDTDAQNLTSDADIEIRNSILSAVTQSVNDNNLDNSNSQLTF